MATKIAFGAHLAGLRRLASCGDFFFGIVTPLNSTVRLVRLGVSSGVGGVEQGRGESKVVGLSHWGFWAQKEGFVFVVL